MSQSSKPTLVVTAVAFDYSTIDAAQRDLVQSTAENIRDRLQATQQNLIVIGKYLLQVKELLPHGQFVDWCKAELQLSERMAQNLLNAGRVYGANPKRVSGFSDSAIYLLAAPSTPEPARRTLEDQARANGKPPTRKQAKAIIDAHKPPAPEAAGGRGPEGALAASPEKPTANSRQPAANKAARVAAWITRLTALKRDLPEIPELTGLHVQVSQLRRQVEQVLQSLEANQ